MIRENTFGFKYVQLNDSRPLMKACHPHMTCTILTPLTNKDSCMCYCHDWPYTESTWESFQTWCQHRKRHSFSSCILLRFKCAHVGTGELMSVSNMWNDCNNMVCVSGLPEPGLAQLHIACCGRDSTVSLTSWVITSFAC